MRLFFILLLAMLINSCHSKNDKIAVTNPHNIAPPISKINGITLVATRNPIDSSHITPLKNYHANYAKIVPYAWMESLEKPQVNYDEERGWWGEKPDGVKKTIALMKAQKLDIFLKPQIWIGHGDYTGNIRLKNEADWKLLEDTYTDYIMRFVKIAAREEVALFCIGTELDSFVELRPQYWDKLIIEIRKIYKGKITYAGNWDSYKKVHFWNQLDYIGVDAYFPISKEKTPNDIAIKVAWKKWVTELEMLSRKLDKKILFAEYGYISADYAGEEPWKNAGDDRLENQPAQAILLQGLYDAVWHQEWFAGGFLWKHHAEDSRHYDFKKRFTTQGKEGEKVVAANYLKFSY